MFDPLSRLEQGFGLLLYQASRPSETTSRSPPLAPGAVSSQDIRQAHQSAGGMVILATIFTFIFKFATAVAVRPFHVVFYSELSPYSDVATVQSVVFTAILVQSTSWVIVSL